MRGLVAGVALLVAVLSGAAAGAEIHVVDGDTVDIDRVRVRIQPIDTPETWEPRCAAELELGLKAKARLVELLGDGSGVRYVIGPGRDPYRRTLARVYVGDTDVGEVLMSEGLALLWTPGPKAKAARLAQWCSK
jgi:endonuclease YncB( thermonuclease family)